MQLRGPNPNPKKAKGLRLNALENLKYRFNTSFKF